MEYKGFISPNKQKVSLDFYRSNKVDFIGVMGTIRQVCESDN